MRNSEDGPTTPLARLRRLFVAAGKQRAKGLANATVSTADTVGDTASEASQVSGRLPMWRIGLSGGLVGIMCCVGPTVLALTGVVSGATALAWGTKLYGSYAWAFRIGGLAVLVVLVWKTLRRRNQCSVAGVRQVRWRLAGTVAIAAGTYVALYAVTKWLERFA
ncbi:hypothetical protein [Longimycelium tulufanense]|uniref:hypothetical protein n=1 Tax=Longimycelium tulufanense TaxID=907463 RepID=UPI001E40D8C1|nr:hypothetical protein [Longimycelium tulufanense]